MILDWIKLFIDAGYQIMIYVIITAPAINFHPWLIMHAPAIDFP